MSIPSSKRQRIIGGEEAAAAAAIPPMNDQGFSVETRDALPAHLLVQIEACSLLSKHGIDQFYTRDFPAGGYEWRLLIYLDDDKHISVQLGVANTTKLPKGWEVNAMFNFFLYNQISDCYLCFRGIVRRFHANKPQWLFSKLMSKETLMDPSNGYIVDDKCMFGAEVHLINTQYVTDHLLLKDLEPYKREWKIARFSGMNNVWESEKFIAGDCTWKIRLYPDGDIKGKGRGLSIYLDCINFASTNKVKVVCYLRIKGNTITIKGEDKTRVMHTQTREDKVCCWYTPSSPCWGWSSFMPLTELRDPNKGFLVNDCCVVEIELTVHAVFM